MAGKKTVPSPGNGQSVPPPPVSDLLADRMGRLKILIDDLQAEYSALRRCALSSPPDAHFGQNWFITVYRRSVRHVALAKAERLLPSDVFAQLVETHDRTFVKLTPTKPAKPPKPVKPPRKPHLTKLRLATED
jgi:hypothetical protein